MGHTLCVIHCYYCDFTIPFVRRQSAMPKPDPTHLKGGKHTSRKFPATSQLSIKPDESSSQENVNRIITFGSMPSYRYTQKITPFLTFGILLLCFYDLGISQIHFVFAATLTRKAAGSVREIVAKLLE